MDKEIVFIGQQNKLTASNIDISTELLQLDPSLYVKICRKFWWFDTNCHSVKLNEDDDEKHAVFPSKFFLKEGTHKIYVTKTYNSKPLASSKLVKFMLVGQMAGHFPIIVSSVNLIRTNEGAQLRAQISLKRPVLAHENILVYTYSSLTGEILSKVKSIINDVKTVNLNLEYRPDQSYYVEIFGYRTTWGEFFQRKKLLYREYFESEDTTPTVHGFKSVEVLFKGPDYVHDDAFDENDAVPLYSRRIIREELPPRIVTEFPYELLTFVSTAPSLMKRQWEYAYYHRLKTFLPRSDSNIPTVLTTLYPDDYIDVKIIYTSLKLWHRNLPPPLRDQIEIINPSLIVGLKEEEIKFFKSEYPKYKRFHVFPISIEDTEHWVTLIYDKHRRLIVLADSNPLNSKKYYGEQISIFTYILEEYAGLTDVPVPDERDIGYFSKSSLLTQKRGILSPRDPIFDFVFFWNEIPGIVDRNNVPIVEKQQNDGINSGLFAIINTIFLFSERRIEKLPDASKKTRPPSFTSTEISDFRKLLFVYLGSMCQRADPSVSFPLCFGFRQSNSVENGPRVPYQRTIEERNALPKFFP